MTNINNSTSNIVKQIKGSLRFLTITTVILYIALGAMAFITFDAASTTHSALCSLKMDLIKRVSQSNAFLAKHPEGFAGISAATLKQSIDNQQRTIDALGNLHC